MENVVSDFDQIDGILKVLSECTDEFLYIYDIKKKRT